MQTAFIPGRIEGWSLELPGQGIRVAGDETPACDPVGALSLK